MLQNQGGWRLPKLFRTNTEKRKSVEIDTKTRKQLVSEKLWPSTLDHESYKAALILRSFCRDGLRQDALRNKSDISASGSDTLMQIPPDIISKAKGLIICSILRAGLWESGAGGSGVAVARLEDGSWSCPAAIQVQTAEIGVIVGVDIYDCILVLNSDKSVEAVRNGRFFVGADLYAVSGPLTISWFMDSDNRSRNAPVFSYIGSQNYFAVAELDNTTFVTERLQENEDFYSPQKIAAVDILRGKVTSPPSTVLSFREMLRVAQGDKDVDNALIPIGPPPSDFKVVEEGHAFGVPDIEDPDPYGVMALEKQGLLLRDAQTKRTALPETFDFNPSLTSPVHERYHRRLGDSSSLSGRSSWRASTLGGIDRFDDRASTRSTRTGADSPTLPTSPDLGTAPPASPPIQTGDREPTLEHGSAGLYSSGKHSLATFSSNLDTESVEMTRQFIDSKPIVVLESESELQSDRTNESKDEAEDERPINGNQYMGIIDHNFAMDGNSEKHDIDTGRSRSDPNAAEEVIEDVDVIGVGSKLTEIGENPRGSNEDSTESEEADVSDLSDDQFEDPDEEFEVFDANHAQPVAIGGVGSISISKPKVVEVSHAVAPTLPTRNPTRIVPATDALGSQISNSGSRLSPAEFEIHGRDSTNRDRQSTVQPVEPVSPLISEPEDGKLRRLHSISSVEGREKMEPSKNMHESPKASLLDIRKGLRSSPSPSPERSMDN